jgi:hypothetical protein
VWSRFPRERRCAEASDRNLFVPIALFLAVKNAGNTIDPIAGRVRISGRYRVGVRLTQAGHRVGGLRRGIRLR